MHLSPHSCVTIPDSFTSIGVRTFDFRLLSSVTIPDSATSLAVAFDFTPLA